jgi:hypothetical protein
MAVGMAKSTRNNGLGSTEKETKSSKGEIRKRRFAVGMEMI